MSAISVAVLVVVLCAVFEGAAQLSFKKSALVAGGVPRWIAVGVALFTVQALLYTGALHYVEVSIALPIGSVSYVVVAVLSQAYLKEPVTRTRWIGIALIMVGVGLLAADA